MAWTLLLIASAFEIVFALSLKSAHGFSRPLPSLLSLITGVASVVILAQALRTLPVGTGYAMWTGIGAVGTAVLGIWLFQEPTNLPRLICIGLIVGGLVGLRLATPAS
jgi:quaternary ammonium compound-resistance protein SugE